MIYRFHSLVNVYLGMLLWPLYIKWREGNIHQFGLKTKNKLNISHQTLKQASYKILDRWIELTAGNSNGDEIGRFILPVYCRIESTMDRCGSTNRLFRRGVRPEWDSKQRYSPHTPLIGGFFQPLAIILLLLTLAPTLLHVCFNNTYRTQKHIYRL